MTENSTTITIEYSEFVGSLVKPADDIHQEITPKDMGLIHMIMGICGEAGELLDAIKKHVIYKKELDSENVLEELGDIEFYLEGIRQDLGITREECIINNINKLSKRYHQGKYSNTQAIERADKT
jgi:NTP pyrophosphatase (non-canonical NTP hydrolase)